MQQWALESISAGDYWLIIAVIFAASMIEYFFPPFPGDTVVLFGAFFSGLGGFSLFILWIVSSAGSLTGSLCLYYLSLKKGRKYFIEKDRAILTRSRLMKLESWFYRYGSAIIVVNRFMPGFRPLFFIAAGLSAVSFLSILVYSALSILMWNGLLTYIGYTAGNNWNNVIEMFKKYSAVTTVIALSLLAVWILCRYLRQKK